MCLHPFIRKDDNGNDQAVPCGKCPECRTAVVNAWSFRLLQQLKVADYAVCATLTYDNDHVPINEYGALDLCKRDLQLFWKRLRKADTYGKGIKYFVVGEYGDASWRPHYHAIIFNAKWEDVDRVWDVGAVHFGPVGESCVRYIMKYVMKVGRVKIDDEFGRVPEFRCMSKGLGSDYYGGHVTCRVGVDRGDYIEVVKKTFVPDNSSMLLWHKADLVNRMYCNLPDNKKTSMPRYYKDRLYSDTERDNIAFVQSGKAFDRQVELMQRDIDDFGYEKAMSLRRERIKFAYAKMYSQSVKNSKL